MPWCILLTLDAAWGQHLMLVVIDQRAKMLSAAPQQATSQTRSTTEPRPCICI